VFSEVFTVVCALLGVVGLMFLAFWAAGWLRKRFGSGGFGSANRAVKIRECTGIGQDKQLIIVTVGSKTMLLGVTPNAVTKVCDLEEEDIAALTEESPQQGGFAQSLKKALAERKGGADISESKKDGRNEKNDL